jgi:polyisoprenoid-binding protein YceI
MKKPVLVLSGALVMAWPLFSGATAPASGAQCYSMDPAKSSLSFTADQMGAPFEGRFHKFTASISFSAADLAASSFDVTVDPGSADTQEEQRDGTLRGSDFFDVEHFKTAHFATTSFSTTKTGTFAAIGKLTLRDVTRDVKIAFSFTSRKEGAATVSYLVGSANLKRLDFRFGRGEYEDTAAVGNDVKIKFNLRLLPAARPPDKKIPTPPVPPQTK